MPSEAPHSQLPYLFAIRDWANLLRTTEKAIREMRHEGKLPVNTHRIGRRPLWERGTVLAWLEEKRVDAALPDRDKA